MQRVLRCPAAVLWLLPCLGCTDAGGRAPAFDGGSPDGAVLLDAAADAASDGGVTPADGGPEGGVERIRIAATEGTLDLGFRLDVEGSGRRVSSALLVDGVGTVRIDGADSAAVVYERIAWPEAGYTLYQALAVGPEAWRMLWFYCRDGALETIYFEGTDGIAMQHDGGSGTCTETMEPVSVPVSLPPVDMPYPELLDGWHVSGTALSIEPGAPGFLHLGDETMEVLPFELVDCSDARCGSGDWYELHSLLWSPRQDRACFGIFYLEDTGASVRLAYSITLPDLFDPDDGLVLDATWSRD